MSGTQNSGIIDHGARRRSGARAPVLLYDDDCSICRRFVSLLIGADRRGTLRIAPLSGPIGDALRRTRPALEPRDSAIWIAVDGTVSTHSDAMLDAIAYLDGALTPLSKVLRSLVPRLLRDRAYTAFANNRSLFGQFGMDELDERSQSRTVSDTGEASVHAIAP